MSFAIPSEPYKGIIADRYRLKGKCDNDQLSRHL